MEEPGKVVCKRPVLAVSTFFSHQGYCLSGKYYLSCFQGNDDEADNETRRFAVLSYIDLLEKPVLPDILVWVICWVSRFLNLVTSV